MFATVQANQYFSVLAPTLVFQTGLAPSWLLQQEVYVCGGWNTCSKVKGCWWLRFAVTVIFGGTISGAGFSPLFCSLPCQCPSLAVGKNLTNANAGEDVFKIILAWNWQWPRLFFRRAAPGRKRFPRADGGSLARPLRQFCSHDCMREERKNSFCLFGGA